LAPTGKGSDVVAATLSEHMPKRVDLLKMDIEGAEHEVLRYLAASRKIDNVDQMVMEYHHHVSPERIASPGF
jgi:FkbM family methyltransferase